MPHQMPEIRIADDVDGASRAAAEEFVALAREAIDARGRFTVALAGGSTPRHLYRLLADDPGLRSRIAWPKIDVFWGDERHVAPDHDDSNYRMAQNALLAHVPVPLSHIHRIHSENPSAAVAADEYAEELRTAFGGGGTVPRFDLILLGLGADGHTASLFPGTDALAEGTRLVVANWVEKFHTHRITMTLPLLNAAACVVFLVSGPDKASVVRAILGDPPPERPYPAQLVRPRDGRLIWMFDRAAARDLVSPTHGEAS
jgi:6-phosphogluconolactonase